MTIPDKVIKSASLLLSNRATQCAAACGPRLQGSFTAAVGVSLVIHMIRVKQGCYVIT